MWSSGHQLNWQLKLSNLEIIPANIRLHEDVFKTSWRCLSSSSSEDVFSTSSRRLDQDEYIRLNHTSSEDVFIKINIFVLVIRLQDVLKTSSRRLQDVLKTSSKRLQDVLKTSSRHLQDVFKTYYQVKLFLVTQFQDVFETYLKRSWDLLLRPTVSCSLYYTF